MAKRNDTWTEEKIARYLKEGRGSGEFEKYKPWLTNQTFASKGRTHRIKSWKTNRMVQLFSDLERDYFYLLEWAENVLDIREQYPLDRETTTKIAQTKQINHSIDELTNVPIVMTTDFFITMRVNSSNKYFARTLKHSEELNKKRVIEKLEIERTYWESLDVDWGIVTEKDIPFNLSNNIEFIHGSFNVNDNEVIWIKLLHQELIDGDGKIIEILDSFNEKYNLDNGTSMKYFKTLLAQRMIKLDLRKKINFDDQKEIITFKEFVEYETKSS